MEKSKIFKIIIILLIFFAFSFTLAHNFNKVDFADKIVFIPIKGEIVSGNENGILDDGVSESSEIINYLDKANNDHNIKAIILEINSPGGSALASKEIVDKVKTINKPVIAWIRTVGASGAYWVASASDVIIADELSITGSIGVIGSYLEYEGLMKKYGVTYERLVTGKYKDMGTPFKELTQEERDLLKKKLNMIHNIFSKDVSNNRKKDLSSYSTGEFFLGLEAKEIGLVDYLGGREFAINMSKELAHISKAELVTFQQRKGFLSSLDKYISKYSFNLGLGISKGLLLNNDKYEINT